MVSSLDSRKSMYCITNARHSLVSPCASVFLVVGMKDLLLCLRKSHAWFVVSINLPRPLVSSIYDGRRRSDVQISSIEVFESLLQLSAEEVSVI